MPMCMLVWGNLVLHLGKLPKLDVDPYQNKTVNIDLPALSNDTNDYHFNIYGKLANASKLIPQGHVLAYEQFELQKGTFIPKLGKTYGELVVSKKDSSLIISADIFKIDFDTNSGLLKTIDYGNGNILKKGLTPNFWRAPTDNDFGFKMPNKLVVWKEVTKTQKIESFNETKVGNTVSVNAVYNLSSVKDAKVEITYIISSDGAIQVETKLNNIKEKLPMLPRFGTNFIINEEFNHVKWMGRGPHENYQDRKTSALVGQYEANVADLYFPYIRPQENGYKTDTRWVSFLNQDGFGLKITAPNHFGFSAHHQYNDDFDAGNTKKQRHTVDIEKRDFVNINIDKAQMGVGGDNSWGAMPHQQYRIKAKDMSFMYIISKVDSNGK